MRRILLAATACFALSAGVARAGSIGVGPYGGVSFPVLQEDVEHGTLFGVRVPVKLVPMITVEPYYASTALGDKTVDVGGISMTRAGFDETGFGANVMLTLGGPVSFYPFAGLGSTKLERSGSSDSFTTYNFGLGLGISPAPKITVHIRGELQAVVDGEASRKFGNATIGASYSLFSIP